MLAKFHHWHTSQEYTYVLVFAGRHVLIGPHLENIFFLVGLPGNTNDLVGSKRFCEDDAEVAQSTDTDDADLLTRTAAVVLQWAVKGDTTAKHGRRGL